MGYNPKRKDDLELFDIYSQDVLEFCLMSIAGTLPFHPDELVNIDIEYKWQEPSELFALLDDHLSHAGKQDIARLDEILKVSF